MYKSLSNTTFSTQLSDGTKVRIKLKKGDQLELAEYNEDNKYVTPELCKVLVEMNHIEETKPAKKKTKEVIN